MKKCTLNGWIFVEENHFFVTFHTMCIHYRFGGGGNFYPVIHSTPSPAPFRKTKLCRFKLSDEYLREKSM